MRHHPQPLRTVLLIHAFLAGSILGGVRDVAAQPPKASPPAAKEAAGKAYVEAIAGTELTFRMVPIPGGTFTMGSPAGEAKRAEDEGPQNPSRSPRSGWPSTR